MTTFLKPLRTTMSRFQFPSGLGSLHICLGWALLQSGACADEAVLPATSQNASGEVVEHSVLLSGQIERDGGSQHSAGGWIAGGPSGIHQPVATEFLIMDSDGQSRLITRGEPSAGPQFSQSGVVLVDADSSYDPPVFVRAVSREFELRALGVVDWSDGGWGSPSVQFPPLSVESDLEVEAALASGPLSGGLKHVDLVGLMSRITVEIAASRPRIDLLAQGLKSAQATELELLGRFVGRSISSTELQAIKLPAWTAWVHSVTDTTEATAQTLAHWQLWRDIHERLYTELGVSRQQAARASIAGIRALSSVLTQEGEQSAQSAAASLGQIATVIQAELALDLLQASPADAAVVDLVESGLQEFLDGTQLAGEPIGIMKQQNRLFAHFWSDRQGDPGPVLRAWWLAVTGRPTSIEGAVLASSLGNMDAKDPEFLTALRQPMSPRRRADRMVEYSKESSAAWERLLDGWGLKQPEHAALIELFALRGCTTSALIEPTEWQLQRAHTEQLVFATQHR